MSERYYLEQLLKDLQTQERLSPVSQTWSSMLDQVNSRQLSDSFANIAY
jgi:cytochrome c553